MEITNEQYEQVLRYVDGEMNPAESKAFEAVIIQNIELRNEVEFYKEIRSLCESIEQKMCNINMFNQEEKTINDEVLLRIKKARTDWENTYENKLRKEQGLPLREEKNIQNQELNNIGMTSQPVLMNEKGNVQQPVIEESKIKRIYGFKWLAAAVLIGFISLGVVFWYYQNNNEDSRIAYTKKESKPEAVHKNKTQSSQQKSTPPGVASRMTPAAGAADKPSPGSAVQDGIKAERDKLFAKNFKPDNLPLQIPGPLEDPSADYKSNKPQDAIEGYKKVIEDINETENSDVAARGDDDNIDLIAFYAHYYLAQSYMSINNGKAAVRELEKAIKLAPDNDWESKVQWYLALAYIKAGQIQRAETLLKEVINNAPLNDFKQRADKLIYELKKNRIR